MHVDLELQHPLDYQAAEGVAAAILNELGRHSASAAATGDRVSTHVSLKSESPGQRDDAFEAVHTAVIAVWGVVEQCAPVRRLVAAELVADDEMDRRLDEATIPPLASATDAAGILGVSRQRVHQLLEQPAFPQPIARTAAGPLWLRNSIDAFDRTWDRKPGRRYSVIVTDTVHVADGIQAS